MYTVDLKTALKCKRKDNFKERDAFKDMLICDTSRKLDGLQKS